MKKPKLRLTLALILTPLIPAALLFLGALFALVMGQKDAFKLITLFAGVSALVGYPFALLSMLPLYAIYQKLGLIKLWQYMIAGIILGAIVGWVFWWLEGKTYTGGIFIGPIWGCITALCFWLFVRPQKTAT